MKGKQVLVAVSALALTGAPALAQGNPPAAAGHQHGDMGGMVCTMGVLPHAGMGGGSGMMGQGMAGGQQGGMMGGMRHGASGGMQHGAAGHGTGAAAEPEHPVTPTMLIHHAQDLGLTADQQAKVSELAKTSQASCEQHLQAAQASHRTAAAELEKAGEDLDEYEDALEAAAEHMIQAHLAVVKAGAQAKALLTPEQRKKLESTAAGMHGGK